MKITVLGCGAMGQLWLTALHRQGHELQGWLRVTQPSFRVKLLRQADERLFSTTFSANNPDFLAASDLLLVTLKAWQVPQAVRALAPKLATGCPILLLHNGMGTLDELGGLAQPLLVGVTTQAAKRDGDRVVHVASGTTYIGTDPAKASAYRYLAATLHMALPDVAWHDDIRLASWNKLAVNCAINPLTVRYNCRNGELRAHRETLASLCHEVAQVMALEGYPTSPHALLAYVEQVMESTADNTSSMLQDIRMQRRTEIDAITGYLLNRANAHGIPMPVNTDLYNWVKHKESTYERQCAGLPGTGD